MMSASTNNGEGGPKVPVAPLPATSLYRRADLSRLEFQTTADLAPLDGLVGQARARDALRLGTAINAAGFNVFVTGSEGARTQEAVKALLRDTKPARSALFDWVYVNNFSLPHRPVAIQLPPGRAIRFRDRMHALIQDLKLALPAAFESADYHTRHDAIDEAGRSKQEAAFAALRDKAAEKSIAILRTPMGFGLVPVRQGKVVAPEEFAAWPEKDRQDTQKAIEELEPELEQTLRAIPGIEKERREALRALDRDTAQFAVGQSLDEVKKEFADLPPVLEHLEMIRKDLIENIELFATPQTEGEVEAARNRPGGPFDRYEVNVVVSSADTNSEVPIVEELHPTLGNLIGRIEYLSLQGALVTNFRLIKGGALHRANGGYLLLDLRSLLMEPYSWSALKRALLQRQIVIEDVARFVGLTSTVSLDPDPIPLDVKVVLFADRQLYYLLNAVDPEASRHFKVLADFEDAIERTPATETTLAHLVAAIARSEKVRPIDRAGVGRTIEHTARLAEDADRLSLLVDNIRDLVMEADFWAADAGRKVITSDDIERALDQQIHRAARIHERSEEMILRDIAKIDTAGTRVGQINGLSVIMLGNYPFGRPSRITSRVRPGTGKIVDIEREVALGGPIHSKGVLILSGFLTGRFALDTAMSVYASLVFEQSYGGVEGDSASSAELYALLSALSEVPLRQDLAVTGSVNQHGEVQAIGGVNEKIEGFFDLCQKRGLTGTQGVLIPKSNVQHLMLRKDVAAMCEAGRFAVYPIESIDQGIELLTGRPAGQRSADHVFPEGSINRLVEDRLRSFAKVRRTTGTEPSSDIT
jgi:lon-related putative ATP-dependent protease